MSGPSEHRSSFGDTDHAADRLELLGEVFAPPGRSVLRSLGAGAIGLAVDLGCGPGASTRLIAEELAPEVLVGLDLSEAFLARARRRGPAASWYRHDVTVVPFPTGPADLLYARLVLAHLPDAEAVMASWLTQLRPGGRLVIEEDDAIATDVATLSAYDDLAASLVAHRGGDLLVGRRLAQLVAPPGYECRL
ncbi:MAG TPA: class I SAM-dependent methyltransferase, partial [Acidimicrobiales bacterium]|nr:class I SAM-dependent methyltransferase [Acidimicrobiales bacterium]